jgi:hypothetical protein
MAFETVLALFDALSSDHIDNPTRAADLVRASGLAPVPSAELIDRLRHLHGTMLRARRRDRELSALLASARELVELRDLNALLHRLVARAHELMGTDVAYLSEVDPDTMEVCPRSTAGTITDVLLRLRVPPGVGLAGKVADTRVPQWTACYQRYDGVAHTTTVDDAAAAEGLVAILGVPMLAGSAVLGVLFAANRVERAFTPDEVALLSAFADHAAIVLQTARLLDHARQAAAETERAYAKLSARLTALERASAIRNDLTAAVLRGETVDDVAQTLASSLRRSVTLLDGQLGVVTATDSALRWVGNDELPAGLRPAITDSQESGRCVVLDSAEVGAVVAIVAGRSFLGALVVGNGPTRLGSVEQRTVERAGQLVGLLRLRQDAMLDAEEQVRGELVGHVLSKDPERRRDLSQRARSRHVRLEELCTVVAVVVQAEYRQAALRALHALTAPGGLAGEHAGTLIVLLPNPDAREAARQVRARVMTAVVGPVLAVAAPAAADPAELPDRFGLADRCARLVPALGTKDAAVTTDEYLPYSVLFGPDVRGLGTFVQDTIGPIIGWDAGRGTDLLETLRCFVQCNASPTRTARELHLHTNTVLQRLERISALLGAGWREPEALFRISIAVRMHALTARDDSHS